MDKAAARLRQKAVQVQAQVAFGRRLAPAVFGPVHARSHQTNHRGVHDLDGSPESVGQTPPAPALAEARGDLLQMPEHVPKKLFGHPVVAHFVGMAERVLGRRSRPADGAERTGLQTQRVADVIETQGMRHLRINHRHHLTPATEGARPTLGPAGSRQLRHQMRRNKLANLPEDGFMKSARSG